MTELTGSIGVERTYSLGNYINLKVTDTINNIPQAMLMDEEAIGALRALQLLRLDAVYFNYVKDSNTFAKGLTTEESLEMISQATVDTTEKLHKAVASKEGE